MHEHCWVGEGWGERGRRPEIALGRWEVGVRGGGGVGGAADTWATERREATRRH